MAIISRAFALFVTPAQAGVQTCTADAYEVWIPAFAGMTVNGG